MILFRYPLVLLLLLLVPAWVWLRHARRRRAPLTFPDGDALAALPIPKLYAYGRDVAPETRAFLDEHAVPTRPFPTDCHFLMQAMPGEFYSMLGEFCG